MKITGRKVINETEATSGEWSIEEINNFLKNGGSCYIHLSGYYMGKKEEHRYARASSLYLPAHQEEIRVSDNDIIIPTYFMNHNLPYDMQDDKNEIASVECIVDGNDDKLYVSIHID